MREALQARGVTVEAGSGLPGAGHVLLLTAQGEETYDLVRDVVADLGLGLVRMEQRRHHISEVFATEDEQRKEAAVHGG
jgi:ABC-2 type transport system ATP-binding protein